MSLFPRSSGVLLHPTSLPGRYGIGDFGQVAYDFVDTLVAAGQAIWQVLPLGPTGFAESPYQCHSSFAGNTNLISLDDLEQRGWLRPDELDELPTFSPRKVSYETVITHHNELLSLAFDRFLMDREASAACEAWCSQPEQWWLDDFAMFMSLKEYHGGRVWVGWTEGEVFREKASIGAARGMHQSRIAEHRFRQWVFYEQWLALKAYANERNIRIVGDIPIYVAHDSSDVWTHPELFDLDHTGDPSFIAGVPPDYFSTTGQRWGNPLYLWEEHRKTGYDWWIKRLQATLKLVDIVRIDHFRAFDTYYKIPASRETAQGGRWVHGPKLNFFQNVSEGLNTDLEKLPIIAEDLGDDIEEAVKLRKRLKLPGMAILQFAFGGNPEENSRFWPDNHEENMVVYTGTHDNNTALGWWYNESGPADRERLRQYVGQDDIEEPHWTLIEIGMRSRAHTFITPLQDIIGGGPSTRMNKPGVPGGNWRWRCTPRDLAEAPWDRLKALAKANRRAK